MTKMAELTRGELVRGKKEKEKVHMPRKTINMIHNGLYM
jgi:hypothetical protein